MEAGTYFLEIKMENKMEGFESYESFNHEYVSLPGIHQGPDEIAMVDGTNINVEGDMIIDAYTPFGIVFEKSSFDSNGLEIGVIERIFVPYCQIKHIKEKKAVVKKEKKHEAKNTATIID